jgi:hypothetical protein
VAANLALVNGLWFDGRTAGFWGWTCAEKKGIGPGLTCLALYDGFLL